MDIRMDVRTKREKELYPYYVDLSDWGYWSVYYDGNLLAEYKTEAYAVAACDALNTNYSKQIIRN